MGCYSRVMTQVPTHVFIVASLKDQRYVDKLMAHLSPLQRGGSLIVWHRGLVSPGANSMESILHNLEKCDIFIFLLSADFLSDPQTDELLAMALEREQLHKSRILPVQLKPISLEGSRLDGRSILPNSRKSIITKSQSAQEQAWIEVINVIRRVAKEMVSMRDKPTDTVKDRITSTQGASEIAKTSKENNLITQTGLLPQQYAKLGFIMLAVCVGLLGLFVVTAKQLSDHAIESQFFYVLLVTLGLVIALITFGAMNSYAHCQGQHLSGVLRIGGPFLAMILVVLIGGFWIPTAEPFDMTIRIFCDNIPVSEGEVTVYLGTDSRKEEIGSKGEVNIKRIPRKFWNQKMTSFVKLPKCGDIMSEQTIDSSDLVNIKLTKTKKVISETEGVEKQSKRTMLDELEKNWVSSLQTESHLRYSDYNGYCTFSEVPNPKNCHMLIYAQENIKSKRINTDQETDARVEYYLPINAVDIIKEARIIIRAALSDTKDTQAPSPDCYLDIDINDKKLDHSFMLRNIKRAELSGATVKNFRAEVLTIPADSTSLIQAGKNLITYRFGCNTRSRTDPDAAEPGWLLALSSELKVLVQKNGTRINEIIKDKSAEPQHSLLGLDANGVTHSEAIDQFNKAPVMPQANPLLTILPDIKASEGAKYHFSSSAKVQIVESGGQGIQVNSSASN